MRYRKEIDGLRAIAVLPVIFFHAHFSKFSGGFVGVDIFFVISGYLITSIICSDLNEGKFSFLNFYERRVRRILPPLYVVAFATFIGALFILFPWELRDFSKSLAALLIFCSNIFFYSQIDYFNPTAEDSPLLHTWSLGVEEQYYFFFPVLAFLLWRGRKQWLIPAIALICLVSFYSAEYLSNISTQAKFYLPQFRAWELAIGALCSLVQHRIPQNKTSANLLSLCGLAMIFYSVIAFTKNTPFPGKYALIPVLGSALVILFATSSSATSPPYSVAKMSLFHRFCVKQKLAFTVAANSNIVTYILSTPLMVGIGLLSYSLYLWHNPIFTFARLSQQNISSVQWFCLIALVFPLSYISWRFIEAPFRNRKAMSSKKAFWLTGIGSIFLCAIAGSTYVFEGYPERYNAQQYDLTVPKASRIEYVINNFAKRSKPFSANNNANNASPRLLIIGDSQAEDFTNMMVEAQLFQNYEIRTIKVPAACQFDFSSHRFENISPENEALCKNITLESINAMTKDADVIVVAAWWTKSAIDHLSATLSLLQKKASAPLFLIGMKTAPALHLRSYIPLSPIEKKDYRFTHNWWATETNAKLSMPSEQYTFINLSDLYCDKGQEKCRLFTDDGNLIFYDDSHLTQAGAKFFGEELGKRTALRAYAP